MKRNLLFAGFVAVLILVSTTASADTAVKPVPVPDMSKLAPAAAKALTEQRAEIEKVQAGLVGPPLAQTYADIGALYARNGFDEAAAIAFYDATQVTPSDGRWFYLRGVIALKLKRDADARENFQGALDRDKVYMPIRYRLADTMINLGDFAAARKVLEETVSTYPKQSVAFSMLGELALKQKRYADAVGAFGNALKLDPKANEIYTHLAAAYDGLGNAAAAADARAKAGNVRTTLDDPLVVGISPRTAAGTAAVTGPATIEQAQALARQGRLPAARAMLVQILDSHPDDVDALSLSARINAATGNIAIAKIEADQAVSAKSNSATAQFSSGLVAEYSGDERAAYDYYRQAQRLDPKLPDTWLMLGNAEMRRGRFAEAAEQYRGLVRLLPNTAEAYAHLTAALVAQGNCGDAIKEINGALAKRPNDGDLMQLSVRTASTCKEATPHEKDVALEYGALIYKQQPDAGNSTAYALALAAHGKFKEAQEYQAEAIFEATRARDTVAAAQYKATMQQFVKQQVPDRPWAADHPYFKAPMLAAAAPVAAPAKTP